MKVLLFGADGQIGHELAGLLTFFADVIPKRRVDADFENVNQLADIVRAAGANLLINAAAYTNVDQAEREPERARLVNAEAVRVLGETCDAHKIGLLHFSTDFVFDGDKGSPYIENDVPHPIGAYGQSKLDGEIALANTAAVIFRTAWVYGLRRKSFVSTMLRLMREQEVLRVVDDQFGNPTSCCDIAIATAMVAYASRENPFSWLGKRRGIYHLAGSGRCSRYELAKAIAELSIEPLAVRKIEPIATDAFPLPARRPKDASLDCSKAKAVFDLALPSWRDSLARVLGR